jgi:hypothetical protein
VSEPRALEGVTGEKIGVLFPQQQFLSGTGHQQGPHSVVWITIPRGVGGGWGGGGGRTGGQRRKEYREYNSCESKQYSRATEGKRWKEKL